MNEKDFIEKYGEESLKAEQSRRWKWYEKYRKNDNTRNRKYREAHLEEIKQKKKEWGLYH